MSLGWHPSTGRGSSPCPPRPARRSRRGRTSGQELERARRQSTFDEVVVGLTEENAVVEARRCLSWGNLFGCDNSRAVCPDNAVLKLRSAGDFEVDYD